MIGLNAALFLIGLLLVALTAAAYWFVEPGSLAYPHAFDSLVAYLKLVVVFKLILWLIELLPDARSEPPCECGAPIAEQRFSLREVGAGYSLVQCNRCRRRYVRLSDGAETDYFARYLAPGSVAPYCVRRAPQWKWERTDDPVPWPKPVAPSEDCDSTSLSS